MNILNKQIALIHVTGWHSEIVDQAKNSFIDSLVESGFSPENISTWSVPGSLEIPMMVSLLAKTGKYSLIAACGLIVNGGIYRHEFVADAVISNLVKASVDHGIPVLSMVLTPRDERFDEANPSDLKFFFDHMKIKGREGAKAARHILGTVDALSNGESFFNFDNESRVFP